MIKIFRRLILGTVFAFASVPAYAINDVSNHFVLNNLSDPIKVDCHLSEIDDYVLIMTYSLDDLFSNPFLRWFETTEENILTFRVEFDGAKSFTITGEEQLRLNGVPQDWIWESVHSSWYQHYGFQSWYENINPPVPNQEPQTMHTLNEDGVWAPLTYEHRGNLKLPGHGGKAVFTANEGETLAGFFRFHIKHDLRIGDPTNVDGRLGLSDVNEITQVFHVECSNE